MSGVSEFRLQQQQQQYSHRSMFNDEKKHGINTTGILLFCNGVCVWW